jgi:hypothetical protein
LKAALEETLMICRVTMMLMLMLWKKKGIVLEEILIICKQRKEGQKRKKSQNQIQCLRQDLACQHLLQALLWMLGSRIFVFLLETTPHF